MTGRPPHIQARTSTCYYVPFWWACLRVRCQPADTRLPFGCRELVETGNSRVRQENRDGAHRRPRAPGVSQVTVFAALTSAGIARRRPCLWPCADPGGGGLAGLR